MGIASYLLGVLEKIARENHYKAFSAYVMRENAAMIRVFKKRYPNLKTSREGGDIEIHMDFDDATDS
jgi:ribosomal protein S18 acetylase RimI-like enzyme